MCVTIHPLINQYEISSLSNYLASNYGLNPSHPLITNNRDIIVTTIDDLNFSHQVPIQLQVQITEMGNLKRVLVARIKGCFPLVICDVNVIQGKTNTPPQLKRLKKPLIKTFLIKYAASSAFEIKHITN